MARPRRVMSAQHGFTFIELVTVVALLGIISVVALPRLVGGNAFGGEEVARQFVAGARLAQQQAMTHTDGSVALEVSRDGAGHQYAVTLTSAGVVQTLFSAKAAFRDVSVDVLAGALHSTLGVGQTLVLAFSPRSALSSVTLAGVAGSITGGVALTVGGEPQRALCVAASGYAHRGACL